MKVRLQRNWQVPAFDLETDGTDKGCGEGVEVELTEAQLERARKAYAEVALVNSKLDELYRAARKEAIGDRPRIMQTTTPEAGE